MPRRNRLRRDEERGDISRAFRVADHTVQFAGGTWIVRQLAGNTEGKVYTCPGCQQALASSLPHVVVWPVDRLGDVTDRRHWHSSCWNARDRRAPRGAWR